MGFDLRGRCGPRGCGDEGQRLEFVAPVRHHWLSTPALRSGTGISDFSSAGSGAHGEIVFDVDCAVVAGREHVEFGKMVVGGGQDLEKKVGVEL